MVGNAIKFTEKGYVRIKVNFQPSDASVGKLVFEVEDTGIGIPKSQQSIIFDAFRQQSGQSNRKYEGTGLGLAITKKLVEKMNGNITLESTLGKGSKFTVVIENVEVDLSRTANTEVFEDTAEKICFEKATVMIVDDVKINIKAIEDLIDSKDISFIEADNGEIALEILNHHKPDVILMDLRMPGMDGFEVTKLIKSQPATESIPVIAFTASVFEQKRLMEEHLFNGVLFKPVSKKKLEEMLVKYVPFHKTANTADTKKHEDQIVLNPLQLEALPGIINTMEQELLPLWENVKNKLLIFKIEEFVGIIAEKNEGHNIPQLSAYVLNMRSSIDTFDLEGIERNIRSFPDLISSLTQIKHQKLNCHD